MKKVLFGISLLMVLLVLFGCTDKFFEPNDPVDLRNCTISADCISVSPKSCCACYAAINKNYAGYWEKRNPDSCYGIQCTDCLRFNNPVVACVTNHCDIIEDMNSL